MLSKPKRFRVIPPEAGTSLRSLLVRRVRELDREKATRLIRAGGVYVNKLRVRLPHVLVAAGERVTVHLDALDAQPFDHAALSIVHRDPEFIVLDKPAGVAVAPMRETAVGCLSEALIHKLEAEGVTRPYVGVVHRLDRGASGLVLFTIRSIANKSLHKQFVEHSIRRGYRIRVRSDRGDLVGAQWRCDAPLVELGQDPDGRGRGVEIAEPGAVGAQTAVSHFRHVAIVAPVRGEGPSEHLFDVELETGRTHQIRAHAAHLGIPVVGDRRYGGSAGSPKEEASEEGADESERERLCLHAWTLDFAHPRTGASLHFEAPLPDWAAPLA